MRLLKNNITEEIKVDICSLVFSGLASQDSKIILMAQSNKRGTITTMLINNILYPFRRKSMLPKIGQPAPEFTIKDHLERTIRLADYRGKRNIVLAFFPLAWTPV